MVISSQITEQDFRALHWHVILPERLRWAMAVFFPGAVLFLLLFGSGGGHEVITFARAIARLCFMAFFVLSSLWLWTYFRSRRERAGLVRRVGPYTFELEDRRLVVTDCDGLHEYSTHAVKVVEETPEHVFIIMRRGHHYVIPRRGLSSAQEEAVKSFREVVAFASLHIDMLERNQVPYDEAISTFNMVRWGVAPFLLLLPFTFGSGLLGARALVTAVLCGTVILASALSAWRFRKRGAYIAIILVWFFGPGLAGLRGYDVPPIHFFQWLCLTGCLVTLPLLLFPRFFRRLARIEKSQLQQASEIEA
jgi:hypothetical protein